MHELVYLIRHHGMLFVFANVLAEQMGLPIPAIPTLVVAGALIVNGDFGVGQILFAALGACIIADSLWFFLGRRQGLRVLRTLCRISLSPDSCVRQTEVFFERFGNASLLFAKFVPGLSTVAPPMSGAGGVSFATFLLFDLIGSLLWSGAAILTGALFHRAIDRILDALASLGTGAILVVLAALAMFILYKWTERRQFYKRLRMARVTPAEVQAMIERGETPLVLDARSRTQRTRDRRAIPGAIAVDVGQLDDQLRDVLPGREIVLYCT